MSSFANATIMGRLGKDPEVRTVNGTEIATFNIACDTGYGDRKQTTWWKATCFGKTSEIAARYLTKGDPVQVNGEPYMETWQDREGATRQTLCIRVAYLVLLAPKKDEPAERPPVKAPARKVTEDAPFDDEIPF